MGNIDFIFISFLQLLILHCWRLAIFSLINRFGLCYWLLGFFWWLISLIWFWAMNLNMILLWVVNFRLKLKLIWTYRLFINIWKWLWINTFRGKLIDIKLVLRSLFRNGINIILIVIFAVKLIWNHLYIHWRYFKLKYIIIINRNNEFLM